MTFIALKKLDLLHSSTCIIIITNKLCGCIWCGIVSTENPAAMCARGVVLRGMLCVSKLKLLNP